MIKVSNALRDEGINAMSSQLTKGCNVSWHLSLDSTIDYDETKLAVVSAWVDGRIDRLFIDFTTWANA